MEQYAHSYHLDYSNQGNHRQQPPTGPGWQAGIKSAYEAMLDADILILGGGGDALHAPYINHKTPAIQIALEVTTISHRHTST